MPRFRYDREKIRAVKRRHGVSLKDAEAIFAEAGSGCRVRRITSAELGRPAARPAYSVLRSEKGAPRLPHWREGLRACLDRLR